MRKGRWFLLWNMFGLRSGGGECSIGTRPIQIISMQGRSEVNAGFRGQANPKRPRQEECEDRKEMQKESRVVRCTSLNGSTWSTEKKNIRRYKGTVDIFFGVEHRGASTKKPSKDGCLHPMQQESPMKMQAGRIANTSGGVFVAFDGNLGAVIDTEEGGFESIPGNERRIAQAWVNVRGSMRVVSENFWHSEGWTLRNGALLEAVVKQVKATRHPRLITCDANMRPEDFEKYKVSKPDVERRFKGSAEIGSQFSVFLAVDVQIHPSSAKLLALDDQIQVRRFF